MLCLDCIQFLKGLVPESSVDTTEQCIGHLGYGGCNYADSVCSVGLFASVGDTLPARLPIDTISKRELWPERTRAFESVDWITRKLVSVAIRPRVLQCFARVAERGAGKRKGELLSMLPPRWYSFRLTCIVSAAQVSSAHWLQEGRVCAVLSLSGYSHMVSAL